VALPCSQAWWWRVGLYAGDCGTPWTGAGPVTDLALDLRFRLSHCRRLSSFLGLPRPRGCWRTGLAFGRSPGTFTCVLLMFVIAGVSSGRASYSSFQEIRHGTTPETTPETTPGIAPAEALAGETVRPRIGGAAPDLRFL
jgi:hypothetical protein